jgi:type I restriction enzyme S subunit
MAEALFRQWFVDSDYSCKVSDLIEIQNGYAFKSKDFKDVGVNGVIKIKNISGNIVDIYNCDFIDELVASQIGSRFVVETGDILFAMTGAEIGKMGIVPQTERKLLRNQRVGIFKEKYNGSRFLAYLQLKSDYGQDYIDNTATGSAQPNISSSGIVNCDFPNISKEQIIIYSEQLSSLFAKIIFNLGQIRTLEKMRDTLLPKLMSGEVRVAI